MSVVSDSQRAQTHDVSVVREGETHWGQRLVRWCLGADLIAGSGAAGLALVGRFGMDAPLRYQVMSLLFPVAWIGAMASHQLYERRLLGSGPEEFRRVLDAGLRLTAVIAMLLFATNTDLARGYVGVVLPAAVLFGLAGRYIVRRRLHALRLQGRCMQRVIALGRPADVAKLVRDLAREPFHGLQVVGACYPRGEDTTALIADGVPALTGYDQVLRALDLCAGDTVAVVAGSDMSGEDLRRLGWQLEGTGTCLIVSPGVIEVAGPRLSIRPAAGLSMLHVDPPALTGGRLLAKGMLDRALAALALLALAPLFLLLIVAVRTSGGPAFFRQERVGLAGSTFSMLKFRTMVPGAHLMRSALEDSNDHDGVMFKMRHDPRVTRIGALLRKYSLDELPQLINVLVGQMSLVGPRPPLPGEVARYENDALRRLHVKPGLTGLWQVSGRADLTWEESLRLDLRYVDNWSMAMDALILWKTGRAVLSGSGAY